MKYKLNSQGFTVIEAVLIIILLSALAGVGWYVYETKSNNTEPESNDPAKVQLKTNGGDEEVAAQEAKPPAGWINYADDTAGVSFYYPADWKRDGIKITKASNGQIVTGKNIGSYSPKYVFKTAENKWYRVYGGTMGDPEELNEVKEGFEYAFLTTTRASTKPAVYGWAGEGGGVGYHIAFVDDTSTYLIELPIIPEESDPTGFAAQKEAMPSLLANIKIN